MRIAGCDYSTWFVDIVLVDADTDRPPEWHRYPLTGHDAFDRARSVPDTFPKRGSAFWDNILAVGIEHPAGHHGTRPLMRIQGAILAHIPARTLVQPWTPSGWRKAVGLKGNATKDVVAHQSAWLLWNAAGEVESDWTQDAHDAHLIALATRQAINEEAAA